MAGDVSPIDSDVGSFQRATSRREAARQAVDASKRKSLPLLLPSSRDGEITATGQTSNTDTLPKGQRPHVRQQVHTGRDMSKRDKDMQMREGPRASSALGFVTTKTHATPSNAGNLPPSFGRRSRLMGRGKPETLESRPPWKGSSGRTNVVQPMHDEMHVAPLNLAPKANKKTGRTSRLSMGAFESETYGAGIAGAGATMRRLLPLGSRSNKPRISAPVASASTPRDKRLEAAARSYPSPPHADLDVATSSSPAGHGPSPPSRRGQALKSNPPDPIPAKLQSMNSIRRKPAPADRPTSDEMNGRGYRMTEEIAGLQTPTMSPKGKDDDDTWVPPPSRFSVTTCATSDPGTPRQSADEDQPPLPSMPANITSIMDRKRPKLGSQDSSSTTPDDTVHISLRNALSPREQAKRRPSDSQLLLKVHKSSLGGMADEEDRRASILSLSKPLPLAPPEISSSDDLVSTLNAQIHGIVHRRVNIEKSIKAMTELMPQDRLLASNAVLRRREVEKQKVEGLRQELAELQREEHDLGLKLHRAYKRRDKEAEYEPTGLWVRRVAA